MYVCVCSRGVDDHERVAVAAQPQELQKVVHKRLHLGGVNLQAAGTRAVVLHLCRQPAACNRVKWRRPLVHQAAFN